MVVFEVLTWEAKDEDDEHIIRIMGRTAKGKSVCVSTVFNPYFYIKLNNHDNPKNIFRQLTGVLSYSLVKSKDLWGFQNNESSVFMKLNFKTLEDRRNCDYQTKRMKGIKVYEANLEPVLRMMHRTNIKSTGWMDTGTSCTKSNQSRCSIDLFCNDWKTLSPVDRDDIAPFIIASFDIEAYSSTGKFPSADIKDDVCFQIAFTLKRFGESDLFDKTCLCYKDSNPIPGCNIINFES